jgi:hypothetical protein
VAHIPDDKLSKALNSLSREQLDEAIDKSGLMVKFEEKFSNILRLKQQIQNNKLSKDEIKSKNEEIYDLENKLLEINEDMKRKKTYGLSEKDINDGEGIEAYGGLEWEKMEIDRRRNSEQGQKLLKLLNKSKV